MADPFGDQDQSPGGIGKRPSPTIEGTATEISVEPATEEAARAEPDAIQSSAESEREAAISGGTTDTGEAEDDPPPARASLPELKNFVTHLAAGLLGGLVGVIALAIAWGLPTGQTGGKAPDRAKLEERLAKLEAAPAASGNAGEVAELDTRMEALEEHSKEPSSELSDLTSRVTQLETALKTLGDAAKEGGSVADAAAISQQISEAEQRLQAKIDAALAGGETDNASTIQEIQGAIAELKAKIAALADAELGAGSTSELGPEVSTLFDRVAKLEAALPALAGAVGKDAAGTKSAAVAIAFANLRAAISEGRPFATELDTISTLSSAAADLGVLPAYAEKGIPTAPELARSFDTAKDAALAAAAPPTDDSFLANLMASAQSLVKIRRVDAAATGDTPSAVLARAGAELDKGGLAAAVKEVGSLQGAPRDAFSAWLDQARARLSADETLKRLEGLLLVSVSGGAEPAQR
jgi:hypothetical protein